MSIQLNKTYAPLTWSIHVSYSWHFDFFAITLFILNSTFSTMQGHDHAFYT